MHHFFLLLNFHSSTSTMWGHSGKVLAKNRKDSLYQKINMLVSWSWTPQPPESLTYRGSGGPKIQSAVISPECACMDHVYATTRTIFTLVPWSMWNKSHYDNTNRGGTEYIFISFPQGYISSQASCHNLDYRIFDCLII